MMAFLSARRVWATRYVGLLLLLLTMACTPQPVAPTSVAIVAVKQLATVAIPPTPDAAQREATRRALPTTPTNPPPTATATPTPYIGVFLGTPGENDSAILADVSQATRVFDDGNDTCAIPYDVAFGEGWRSNVAVLRRVGCPLQERFGFVGAVQVFERGVMYRRQDTNEVWAVLPGSIGTGQYWYANNPALLPLPGVSAPPGLRVPADAFGAVWLSTPEVQTALGYATTPEQTADLNLQRFDGGSLVLDVTVGQVFILFDNSDAFGPY
ncbi:MAG: hypothetical protein H7Y11_05590 [Armatimonadetes bacterium]|nr:hypothetical protein [Anaerolineae bacterium]